MENIILIIGIIILFLIGLAGIILPLIPSLPIIWLGISIYGLLTGFTLVTLPVVLFTGILMVIGTALDFFAGVIGAKISGASWYGVLGALLGSFFGFIFLDIWGLLIGAFLGAFLGEYLKYKNSYQAVKAGAGTLLGIVFGSIIKIIIAFLMIGIFVWRVI